MPAPTLKSRFLLSKTKKSLFGVTLFFLFILLSPAAAFPSDWIQLKSEHFIVNFLGQEKFAKEILDKAENYYRNIASDLGYARYSDFWTWDNRVNIYIYRNHADYLKATGYPEWSHGMADYKNKSIISYEFSEHFMDGLLPHELTHLTFRDFVGFKGEVPLWLDEGVAQWEEPQKKNHLKEMVKYLYDKGTITPLTLMMEIDVRKIKNDEQVKVQQQSQDGIEGKVLALTGDEFVSLYYLQSMTMVGFLIETYGSLSFADFCRELRDGGSLDNALKSAYGTRIPDIKTLEEKWRAYLKGLHP